MNLEHKIIDHIYIYEYTLFTYAQIIGKKRSSNICCFLYELKFPGV
jgi:hypothetical protein